MSIARTHTTTNGLRPFDPLLEAATAAVVESPGVLHNEGGTMPTCPQCGATEFEKRGERRTYHPLDAQLKDDGWNHGDVTIDVDDDGEEIIYCASCSAELTEAELTPNTEGAATDAH